MLDHIGDTLHHGATGFARPRLKVIVRLPAADRTVSGALGATGVAHDGLAQLGVEFIALGPDVFEDRRGEQVDDLFVV